MVTEQKGYTAKEKVEKKFGFASDEKNLENAKGRWRKIRKQESGNDIVLVFGKVCLHDRTGRSNKEKVI